MPGGDGRRTPGVLDESCPSANADVDAKRTKNAKANAVRGHDRQSTMDVSSGLFGGPMLNDVNRAFSF
jgi:hypothetical protein